MMFLGLNRHQMEDNVVRIQPVYSTWKMVENFLLYQYWNEIYINILGNILMFIPYGFIGWLFPKYNDLKTLLIYFLSFLIVIEALQYFTRLGVFDIDDIILNTFGVVIGFYFKQIFDNFFEKKLIEA